MKINLEDLPDLFELHRTIDNFLKKVIPALREQKKIAEEEEKQKQGWKTAKVNGENEYDQLIQVLKELGPPPKRTKKEKDGSKSEVSIQDAVSIQQGGNSNLMDFGNLDRLKFFYLGKPCKENLPIFYFITSR